MKRKSLIALLLLPVLLLLLLPSSFSAEEAGVEALLRAMGMEDRQQAIDGILTERAGKGAEWALLAIAQSGRGEEEDSFEDFSSYEAALLAYLQNTKSIAATSRLKYALCLAAVGSVDSNISEAIRDAIGKQGVMSLIFGLHLLNNGYTSERFSTDMLVREILSYQSIDGGFSLSGEAGEVDVTAMALQALAMRQSDGEEVREAIEAALTFLAENQQAGGDYIAYGQPNPESTAQVLIALSALGIDAREDARFIKNGNDLFDGIALYRTPSGGYCHQRGGEENESANAQVLCALVAYERFALGEGSFYLLDHADAAHVSPAEEKTERESEADTEQGEEGNLGYKLPLCIAIAAGGAVACLILLLRGRKGRKSLPGVLLLCAVAIVLVLVTEIRSPEDYYNSTLPEKENPIGTVSLSIRCDAVAGREDYLPKDGVILPQTELVLGEGDSVYTILVEAARANRISIDNRGDSGHAYLAGIAYLYEGDFGSLSGWVFRVNGERVSVGASDYRLKDRDRIEWIYVTDLTEVFPE